MRDVSYGSTVSPRSRRTPLIWVQACFVIATSWAAIGLAAEADKARPQSVSDDANIDEIRATPAGVVEAQMKALSEWHSDPEAAARVFRLASPANKAVTGPLPRFRQMVEAAPYDALLSNEGWSAGKPMQTDSVAAVLVTLIDDDGDLLAFRFYLSKQPLIKGSGWMTDAVIALPLPATPGAAGPPTSI